MEVHKTIPLEPIEVQFSLRQLKIGVTTFITINKIKVAFKECNETSAIGSGGYIIDSNTI